MKSPHVTDVSATDVSATERKRDEPQSRLDCWGLPEYYQSAAQIGSAVGKPRAFPPADFADAPKQQPVSTSKTKKIT
jgi:hypothetical protein